jgi:hypothetical protein
MDEVALKSAFFSLEAHLGIRSVLQHFVSRHEKRDRKMGGPAAAAAGMMSLLVRGVYLGWGEGGRDRSEGRMRKRVERRPLCYGLKPSTPQKARHSFLHILPLKIPFLCPWNLDAQVSSSTADEAKEAAAEAGAGGRGAGGDAGSSGHSWPWPAPPLALEGEGVVEAGEGEGSFDLMEGPLGPPNPGFSFSFELPEEVPWQ